MRSVKVTTHLELMPVSIIRGSVFPLPIPLHGVVPNWLSTGTTSSPCSFCFSGYLDEPLNAQLLPYVPPVLTLNKKFWEELISYFPMIRRGPHIKWRVQRFFYSCLCIHCRGNVFTEPLPSNDKGINIHTHRLMGGIYEVHLRSHICLHGIMLN
jgi:hypothetical protein